MPEPHAQEPLKAELEAAEARYIAEMARRDAFLPRVSLAVTQLAVLGTGLVIAARDFTYGSDVATWVFVPAAVAAAGSFVRAVVALTAAWHGHVYRGAPLFADRDAHRAKVQAWGDSQAKTADEVESAILQQDLVAVKARHDYVAKTNDKRGDTLFKANKWLIWALGWLAVAGVIYVADAAVDRQCSSNQCPPWVQTAFSARLADPRACTAGER